MTNHVFTSEIITEIQNQEVEVTMTLSIYPDWSVEFLIELFGNRAVVPKSLTSVLTDTVVERVNSFVGSGTVSYSKLQELTDDLLELFLEEADSPRYCVTGTEITERKKPRKSSKKN